VPTRPLAIFFTGFMFYAGSRCSWRSSPALAPAARRQAGLFGVGALIGGFSSVLAAGGAFLSIPFLAWCNVRSSARSAPPRRTVFPIAVAGTIGYVLNGLRVEGLPRTDSYVYLPGLALIVAASIPLAPWARASRMCCRCAAARGLA